ncbi:divergent polysaccharide deacetylase family protein [Litoribrevibacter albus]|uniref:Divergent polysaccharide deacetylase family protein n=1 Tax=Litoribrevibacter albus TaxID=1473156 RepID=A0AA37SFZ2_9GAMM|nr:divergent polysaccharide deacetylase family protein [Litoribrevibacter albus]GLQ33529.1 hypothetical protein GCM10007876_40090 [Litoribrevibacter albus]
MFDAPSPKALFRTGLLCFSLLCFSSFSSAATDSTPANSPATTPVQTPKVTIIIDDIGNNESRGLRTVNLLGPVTLAILPNRPYSEALAKKGHQLGKELLLHAPMENLRDMPLGLGALTSAMNAAEYQHQLIQNIDAIPHLMGINNHMGSLLTTKHLQMNWTMKILKEKNLLFVDSKTNPKSVANDVAVMYDVPTVSRDIFLDHVRTTAFINKQYEKCLTIAEKKGNCLMIGHPYPETLDYLEKVLPELEQRGFKQLPLSALIEKKTLARQAHPRTKKSPTPSVELSMKTKHTP